MRRTETRSPGDSAADARAVTAIAHPNIALVKYWGKRDGPLNLPATGSLSITLASIRTRTTVRLRPPGQPDRFVLDGAPREDARVAATIARLRERAGRRDAVVVESDNDFPTAAGLASSASGFAALVTALAEVFELELGEAERSELARLGSGSAARSIFGGFAEMLPGRRADGSDCHARALLAAEDWPLEVVIAITATGPKADTSTDGMERSRRTSPFYPAWVSSTEDDLAAARTAVAARDFEALASVAEHSALKMHATMLATRPPLTYWNGASVEAMEAVRGLRAAGVPAFFTIDAGPQVKVVTLPGYGDDVAAALAAIPGVKRVHPSGLGPGARVVDG